MKKPTLARYFSGALLAAVILFGGGVFNTLCAGPESIGYKDKNPIVEIPTECDPRWYVSTSSGTDAGVGTDFSNGAHEFTDFGAFTTDLRVKSRDYNDVYKNWYHISAEAGYVLTNHLEIFAKGTYTQADSQIITGSKLIVDSPIFGPFALGFPFTSHFDNYQSFGGELGFRYFFTGKQARIRPFISLSGGATWVDSIDLHAKSDFLNFDFTVYDGPFYDESIVGTGTALLGMEYQVIPCKFSVGIDAGVRFNSGLDANDSGFGTNSSSSTIAAFVHSALQGNGMSQNVQDVLLAQLRGLNNNGAERWSIPVSVYGKIRF